MQFAKGARPQDACYAKGGPVIGSDSKFLKTPNSFSDPVHGNNKTTETFAKGQDAKDGVCAPAEKGKSLPAVKPRS
jgi:hypothetical protein